MISIPSLTQSDVERAAASYPSRNPLETKNLHQVPPRVANFCILLASPFYLFHGILLYYFQKTPLINSQRKGLPSLPQLSSV